MWRQYSSKPDLKMAFLGLKFYSSILIFIFGVAIAGIWAAILTSGFTKSIVSKLIKLIGQPHIIQQGMCKSLSTLPEEKVNQWLLNISAWWSTFSIEDTDWHLAQIRYCQATYVRKIVSFTRPVLFKDVIFPGSTAKVINFCLGALMLSNFRHAGTHISQTTFYPRIETTFGISWSSSQVLLLYLQSL